MKTKLLTLFFLFSTIHLLQGQVGIGTTSPQAALDVDSTTDGVLVPRMAADPAVWTGVNGELIYNTTTKEFKYFDGTAWVPIGKNIYTHDGTLSGNRVVTMGANNLNFVSTGGDFNVDSNSFVVDASVNSVGIGTAAPTAKFEINSAADGGSDLEALKITQNKIGSSNLGASINMGAATTTKALEIINNGTGRGMYVGQLNASATSTPIFFENRSATATIVGTTNTGIEGRGAIIGTNNRGTNYVVTLNGYVGVQGESKTTDTAKQANGVVGVGMENDFVTIGVSGSAGGMFELNRGNSPGLNQVTASKVATRNAGTNYKILGVTGAPVVSTSREDHSGKKVILFAPESPMPTYSDYGKGQLVNGRALVTIDPAFANMIYVNEIENAPLRVIIQLEDDCKGVFVTNKTNAGFEVIELQGGNSNAKFTYQIVANQKDYVDPHSGIKNQLQDVRFPELEINKNDAGHKQALENNNIKE